MCRVFIISLYIFPHFVIHNFSFHFNPLPEVTRFALIVKTASQLCCLAVIWHHHGPRVEMIYGVLGLRLRFPGPRFVFAAPAAAAAISANTYC